MANSSRHRSASREKPSYGRFCLLALLTIAAGVRAQDREPATALTEAEAVALALRRHALVDVIEGEVKIEQGRARAAGSYPNPQLSYLREQTFGPLGTGEDNLTVSQQLDLGNRRGLAADAGDARARAARVQGDATRLAIAADARVRFYEVLFRQERERAFAGWLTRIDEALAIVTRRERSGDASTYDVRRLERERAVAAGRIETERALLEGARARLRGLLLGAAPAVVSGALLPDADPAPLAKLRTSGRSRADLRALDQRIEAAVREQTAAARGWVPDLTLQGGWKGIDFAPEGRADGFILGAALSIPVWDRSSGAGRAAEGEAQAARGRRALLESELEAELGGTRAEVVQLRRAASDFRDRTRVASADLLRIASAGYQGGELGLLELLDAYRGAAEDELTALEMAHAARRARLDLDRLTGASLP